MSVLNEIAWLLPELAESQQKIAKFILDNPEAILVMSSSRFAEDAGVSQSAVIKFSQKIGMKGFLRSRLSSVKNWAEITNLKPTRIRRCIMLSHLKIR